MKEYVYMAFVISHIYHQEQRVEREDCVERSQDRRKGLEIGRADRGCDTGNINKEQSLEGYNYGFGGWINLTTIQNNLTFFYTYNFKWIYYWYQNPKHIYLYNNSGLYLKK